MLPFKMNKLEARNLKSNTKMTSDMDVLWAKKKSNKYFGKKTQEVSQSLAYGSGDCCPGTCCKLCGNNSDLRLLGDSGEEEDQRYDEMLFDCFGIMTENPDVLICERCVRHLRNTKRFRVLVLAAFPNNEGSSKHSHLALRKSFANVLKEKSKDSIPKLLPNPSNSRGLYEIIQKNNECVPQKRQNFLKVKKRAMIHTLSVGKRTNVFCDICRQKYLMMVTDTSAKFVCSRCKKNQGETSVCRKCNVAMPAVMMRDHLALHTKAELRRRRYSNIQKKSSPLKRLGQQRKYECSQCSKTFTVADNLAKHIQSVHRNSLDCVCTMCGEDCGRLDRLEKHMATHAGQRESRSPCELNLKTFKSQRSLHRV